MNRCINNATAKEGYQLPLLVTKTGEILTNPRFLKHGIPLKVPDWLFNIADKKNRHNY